MPSTAILAGLHLIVSSLNQYGYQFCRQQEGHHALLLPQPQTRRLQPRTPDLHCKSLVRCGFRSLHMKLQWRQYSRLTEARKDFARRSCVYVQTNRKGVPVRIGKASRGLEARYRGGTGYAIDAGMDGSGNMVFVAAVSWKTCHLVEAELIWQGRTRLPYNNQGKRRAPSRRLKIAHAGKAPDFSGFEGG